MRCRGLRWYDIRRDRGAFSGGVFAAQCRQAGLSLSQVRWHHCSLVSLKLSLHVFRGESYLDVIARLEPIIIEMERHTEPLLIIGHQVSLVVLSIKKFPSAAIFTFVVLLCWLGYIAHHLCVLHGVVASRGALCECAAQLCAWDRSWSLWLLRKGQSTNRCASLYDIWVTFMIECSVFQKHVLYTPQRALPTDGQDEPSQPFNNDPQSHWLWEVSSVKCFKENPKRNHNNRLPKAKLCNFWFIAFFLWFINGIMMWIVNCEQKGRLAQR